MLNSQSRLYTIIVLTLQLWYLHICNLHIHVYSKQAVGWRPRRYAPPLSSLCGYRSASRRRADRNVAVVSHGQYIPTPPLKLPDALTRRWVKRPGDLDLWSFELESGVRVTCDVGYLCANFSLPRPLCSRLRPDVRDRQTYQMSDRHQIRQHHRFMPRLLWTGHNKHLRCILLMNSVSCSTCFIWLSVRAVRAWPLAGWPKKEPVVQFFMFLQTPIHPLYETSLAISLRHYVLLSNLIICLSSTLKTMTAVNVNNNVILFRLGKCAQH